MSEKEYVFALNQEIQKLNEVIDRKILGDQNYLREARRHKLLLAKLRKEEARRLMGRSLRMLVPTFLRV